MSKEYAIGKAVDAVVLEGRTVTEAASMHTVPVAELNHLMLSSASSLLKQEEDAVLLCCMRLSHMGFPVDLNILEQRMEEEISKRPEPCQQSSHMKRIICHRLLRENQIMFKQKLPYEPSDPTPKKLALFSLSLSKMYKDIGVKKASSVLAFTMQKFSVLNAAGNRICNITALSTMSASNTLYPVMLILPHVVRQTHDIGNLIFVVSKEGLVTPNLVSHYLRALFSRVTTRPLIIFFKGNENLLSHQFVSDCMSNSIFLQCVPEDISDLAFPGNHGGVLNSVSMSMKENLIKEGNFIDLVKKEAREAAKTMSQVFAQTGLFPPKQTDSIHLDEENLECIASDSGEEEGLDKENVEMNRNENNSHVEKKIPVNSLKEKDHIPQISSPQNSHFDGTAPPLSVPPTFTKSSISIDQKTTLHNGSEEESSSTNHRSTGRNPQKRVSKSKIGNFRSLAGMDKNTSGFAQRSAKQSLATNKKTFSNGKTGSNEQRGSGKRNSEKLEEGTDNGELVPKRPTIGQGKKLSALSRVEETIDEVIAKSREEAEEKKKEEPVDTAGKSKDFNKLEPSPVRPALKIRRSSQGLVSVLNCKDDNSGTQISQGMETQQADEMSEEDSDSEIEASDGSSENEMDVGHNGNKSRDFGDNEDVDDSKDNVEEGNEVEEDDVPSDFGEDDVVEEIKTDEENDNEALETSEVVEDSSEICKPEKLEKKVKKKAKKKRKHHQPFVEGSEEKNENDAKEKYAKAHKKKKKKKHKSSKRLEEKNQDLSVEESTSPVEGGIEEKLEGNKDCDKKLTFIRRVSLVDHDYQTRFDSDSGTEALAEDSILCVEMDAEETKAEAVGDSNKENSTVVIDKGLPNEGGGDGVADGQQETSDSSDSSSSSSDGESDEDSSGKKSGSSSSSSSSEDGNNGDSCSSGSDSSSEHEDEGENTPHQSDVKNKEKVEIVEEEKEEAQSEVESSSSGESSSASSESGGEEDGEEQSDEEREDEEEDNEGDEDSRCQLCMLSNPPHSKDTIIDWVDCDGNCGRWFHVICINRAQSKSNAKHYICPSCRCKR